MSNIRNLIKYLVCATLLVSSTTMAQSDEVSDDEWHHMLKIYLWGASIGGTTSAGDSIDVGFSDLVDNLEFGMMGGYEARKGSWTMFADGLYLDLEGDRQVPLTPPPDLGILDPVADVTIGMTGTVLQFAGGFNLHDDGYTTSDVFIGIRYLNLDNSVNLRFDAGIPDREQNFGGSLSENFVDYFIGMKGKIELSERWDILLYGDIGTGDTDQTWQAMLGLTVQVSENWDIALTYRHLDWKIRGDIANDINFSGPLLGALWSF